jgi:hypothetical protein
LKAGNEEKFKEILNVEKDLKEKIILNFVQNN